MTEEWKTGGYFDPMDELEARRDRMSRDGYVPCAIPACNCGSWHRRDDEIARLRAGYEAAKKNQRAAERAHEMAEAEIDRLRAALRAIADQNCLTQTHDIAREALGDE